MPTDSAETVLSQPNWEAVKLAYIQGTPLSIIAKDHNLTVSQVRNRAWRAGWRHELHPDPTTQAAAFQNLISEWIENMAVSLLARSKWYANNDLIPSSLRENKDIEAAIASHIASGRMLFGLDKDNGSQAQGWGRGPQSGVVIDVAPVPLPAKH